MKTLDQIPPVKKGERNHIQRQFLKWSKYWMNCKDPKKREQYMRQAVRLGEFLEAELLGKERE